MTIIHPTANLLLPSETIIRLDHEAGKTLSDVAHLQARISAKQDRHDYLVPVSAVPLAFFPAEDGGAVAVLGNDKVKVSKAAFRQLSSQLEVSGLGRMLEQTAKLDSTAKWRGQEARAFEAANMMLRMWTQRVDKTMRWRVCSRRINGEVVRVLDGVVTDGYAPLGHDEALAMTVDHFGGDRSVIEYRLTTNEMRLRIADEPIELGKPVKMVEVWNSENGHRSLSFWGRLWKLVCSNGMAVTHKDYGRARYVHIGDMRQRVDEQLPAQLIDIRRAMGEGVELYAEAERTRIEWAPGTITVKEDDLGPVETFITETNKTRTTKIPDRVLDQVFERGLRDETSSPYGTLAGAVDGITRVAQDEDDLSMQKLLEDIAFDVMQRGLAQRERELIRVRPLEVR
jgi:hypothetical protein